MMLKGEHKLFALFYLLKMTPSRRESTSYRVQNNTRQLLVTMIRC